MSVNFFNQTTVQLTQINCSCGGTYAINEKYRQEKFVAGGHWTCPYCQTWWGYSESEVTRLEKAAARAQELLQQERERNGRLREECTTLERSRNSARGHVTRLKNRIASGKCPCCSKDFEDLASHMKAQHPTYSEASK